MKDVFDLSVGNIISYLNTFNGNKIENFQRDTHKIYDFLDAYDIYVQKTRHFDDIISLCKIYYYNNIIKLEVYCDKDIFPLNYFKYMVDLKETNKFPGIYTGYDTFDS